MTLHEQVVFLPRVLWVECQCVPWEAFTVHFKITLSFSCPLKTNSNSSDVLFINVCPVLKWIYFVFQAEPALCAPPFLPFGPSDFFSLSPHKSENFFFSLFLLKYNWPTLKKKKQIAEWLGIFPVLFFKPWCFPLWPMAFVKENFFC